MEVNFESFISFIGNFNDETNFPHKLLLTDTQVSKIRKAFENGSSANVKFSKNYLSKMVQLGEFLFVPPNIFGSSLPIEEMISLANLIKN